MESKNTLEMKKNLLSLLRLMRKDIQASTLLLLNLAVLNFLK